MLACSISPLLALESMQLRPLSAAILDHRNGSLQHYGFSEGMESYIGPGLFHTKTFIILPLLNNDGSGA